MKETMTPRERVMTAIDHRQPDREPLDFLATHELIASVEEYFDIQPEELDGCFSPSR